MKPIGYYIDTKIPVIGEIEQTYGAGLEKLKQEEKIYLAYSLTGYLESLNSYCHEGEIYSLAAKIGQQLTEKSDAIALLKALVNSL